MRFLVVVSISFLMVLDGRAGAQEPDPPPIVIGPGSVVVTAGTPGSLAVVAGPGPGGAPIRCTWHELVVRADGSATSRPARPVPGEGFVLWCLHPDDSVVDGYPVLVVYDPSDPVPGAAVSSEEAARFALRRIGFAAPRPALSPAGRQVVGVETWLAITSQLEYGPVTAQAGAVWSTVQPVLRDVVWRLGDGRTVVCTHDVGTVWVVGTPSAEQASDCTHVYERSSGDRPHAASATVTWTILWRSDRDPVAWRVFDTLSLTAPVAIVVEELQAAIR